MHAGLTRGQIQPDTIEEFVDIYLGSVIPAANQQPGFKGAILLTDHATGKIASIGLWQTEAEMRASQTSEHLQEQVANLLHLVVGTPVTELYEVSVRV